MALFFRAVAVTESPAGVRPPNSVPYGQESGSWSLDPACWPIIGLGLRSHLGNVGQITKIRWLRQSFDAVGGTYDLALRVGGEAFLTPLGPLSDLVASAVRETLGIEPELSTSGGTSDARFIKDHCAVAELGLVGQTMHKVDEWVSLDDLAALTEVYLAVLDSYFPA